MQMSQIPVSCPKDCSGGCPLLAHVEDGMLKRITDNPAGGSYMNGCVNGFQMPRTLYHPARLKRPLLRTGPRGSGQFRETSWDEALDLVAEKLSDLKARFGPQSILNMIGTGSVAGALHNTFTLPTRFFALFGGCTHLSSNYSAAACEFITPYILGARSGAGSDPGTLQFSKLIILWGANLADTRRGTEMPARLQEARRRGVPIIVIDPRRTRTVTQLSAQWIPCRPGTDTALMMALLHELIISDLIDRDFIKTYSLGFDDLQAHILGHVDGIRRDPAWAQNICGTPAETITRLAAQYGATRPAALIPGLSIQRTIGGEETYRMSIALQVATGNLGIPGGTSGAKSNLLPHPRMGRLSVPDHPAQPSVPINNWPDAVLDGARYGCPTEIKAIYNTASNYLVQGSDVHKNMRAFSHAAFSVTHDYFLTPTALHSDVVLPATTYLERSDIVFPNAGNYLLFSNQVLPPLHEARNDYDIFCALAARLGFLEQFSEGKDEDSWLRSFVDASEVPDYDEFRRTGIYLAPDQLRVGLANFVRDPAAHPLGTPSGRVEISSQTYVQDTGFSPTPECRFLETRPEYPLRLVTPKSKFRIHSQGSNVPWMRKREAQTLWINPDDALQRGIQDGDQVLVHNEQGVVRVAARVTADIMPTVVCLLEGVWPEFDANGVDTAGSPNVLSSTAGTEPSKGTATHSILVQAARADP